MLQRPETLFPDLDQFPGADCTLGAEGCDSALIGLAQVLFLGLCYGAVLFYASNQIADGSEKLLFLPGWKGLVGTVVLPILGAFPEGVMMVFSGIGPHAQQTLEVGVGALAGSSTMLLTIPWALAIFAGRVDHPGTAVGADGQFKAKMYEYKEVIRNGKLYHRRLTIRGLGLTTTGVEVKPAVQSNAWIMLITSVSFIGIQGAAFFSGGVAKPTDITTAGGVVVVTAEEQLAMQAASESPFVLVSMLSSAICFLAYLYYMKAQSESEEANDSAERKRWSFVADGRMEVSGALLSMIANMERLRQAHAAAGDEGKYMLAASSEAEQAVLDHKETQRLVRTFFKKHDVDGDNVVKKGEFPLLMHDLGLGKKADAAHGEEMMELFGSIDASRDDRITLKEFVAWLPGYINQRYEESKSAQLNRAASEFELKQSVQERDPEEPDWATESEGNEDPPSELTTYDPVAKMRVPDFWKIKKAAGCQMLLGTVLVLIFSDPMVDVFSSVGRRLGVPVFFISFVFAPLASNASELVATYAYAAKKTPSSITTALTALEGAAIMNNTFCLFIFAVLIYTQKLAWVFAAETMSIIFVESCVFVLAQEKRPTLLSAFFIAGLYPLSLLLVYVLQYGEGWD